MKKETTKQRILREAVRLFAKDGYEKDIFESILARMNQMDYDHAVTDGEKKEITWMLRGHIDRFAEKLEPERSWRTISVIR